MKYFIYIILIIIAASCKSTKATKDNKLDITHTKIDKTVEVTKVAEVKFSLDEIIVIPHDPKQETTLRDNNGNTHTFKNVKSISIKKQKESIKHEDKEVKNDIKDVLIDKSKIKESKESVSDAKNFKSMFMYTAIIAVCIAACYLVFKFKR